MLASTGASADELNGADTAWILTSTALVLFMTIPGLSLFYAGLVRVKNVLSVLMQCFALTCLMSLVWFVVGYTIAFGSDGVEQGKFIGDFGNVMFASYEHGYDERRYSCHLVRDFPDDLRHYHAGAHRGWLCRAHAFLRHADLQHHLVDRGVFTDMSLGLGWRLAGRNGPAGFRRRHGGAYHRGGGRTGGRMMMGPRKGFGTVAMPPHNLTMTVAGAGMLWVGWFGFNAGSAVAADNSAAMAMLVTHLSAACGSLAWMAMEWVRHGKPSVLGIVTGMVAGLGTITPASGSVGPAAPLSSVSVPA